ncbi:MAG: Fic family protein [Candidatus Diapherotrites archaeon]
MVSRLDVFLVAGLYPEISCADIVRKIGKKQTSYNAAYNLLMSLKNEGLVTESKERFSVSETKKASILLKLVYFCFKNGIDYNKIITEKAAEFVKLGLGEGKITGLPFDTKTVKRIVRHLSKNGLAIVESKRPFLCRIVPSQFTELLAEYFFGKIKVKCPLLVDCLDEGSVDSKLQKHFSEFKGIEKQKFDFDEIGFIYVSLSLEGNTLTLSETERMIRQNIAPASKPAKDAQQVLDYKKALDGFIFSKSAITEDSILDFHRTAMNSLAAGAGQFRIDNVRIKDNPNFKTPEWRELPGLLRTFFENIKTQKKEKTTAVGIVEEAAFLHNEFQRMHPFIDGNSRTSRAIFLKVLTQNNFPLIKIPVGFSDQYMLLTKLSEKRDDKKFALLMKQIALENLKHLAKKIEHEF